MAKMTLEMRKLFDLCGSAEEMAALAGMGGPGATLNTSAAPGSIKSGISVDELMQAWNRVKDGVQILSGADPHKAEKNSIEIHPFAAEKLGLPAGSPDAPRQEFAVGDRVEVVHDEKREKFNGQTGRVVLLTTMRTVEVEGYQDRPAAQVLLDGSMTCELFFLSDLKRLVRLGGTDMAKDGKPAMAAPDDGTYRYKVSFVGAKERPPQPIEQTWAATLELAGGRLVEVPGPDPAVWELDWERRWDAEEGVRVRMRANAQAADVELQYLRPVSGGGIVVLVHDAARCWAHDMARIVNEQGPVGADPQERRALLRSLRRYRRRPPVDPHADRAFPTLRAYLW